MIIIDQSMSIDQSQLILKSNAGLLSDVLDPYEKLTGEDNLVTFFAKNKTDMGQTQRKKFAETCRMR